MEDLHGRKIIIEETERSIQTKLVYLPTMLERSPLTIQCQRCGEVVSDMLMTSVGIPFGDRRFSKSLFI